MGEPLTQSLQGGEVILKVISRWVSCDGLAFHSEVSNDIPIAENLVMDSLPTQRGVFTLQTALSWVFCDGLASHQGEVIIL